MECNYLIFDEYPCPHEIVTVSSNNWPCVYMLSCAQICYPMDCSPPGSSFHEIFQAKILAWFAISYFK